MEFIIYFSVFCRNITANSCKDLFGKAFKSRTKSGKEISLKLQSFTYRRAVRRKANFEVTGEEKPTNGFVAKKASLRPPRRRKASFTCLRRKKASLRRPRTKNYNKRHFAREKNRNLLAKILPILLISRTRNLESIY